MRNIYKYYGFNRECLLNVLLNISTKIDCISILVSNTSKKDSNLPQDYINYEILAGVGATEILISNSRSFDKLQDFHSFKKDWIFGYLSYDLKNEIEELGSHNMDKLNSDNLFFFIPEYVILLNNDILEIQTYHSKDLSDKFVKSFNFSAPVGCYSEIKIRRRDDKKSYLKKIKSIKQHIQAGDIYEVNYCQEFYSIESNFIPEFAFLELNKGMQTPFSSFLKVKEKYVLSASPERFLRKEGSNILSQPIKGTRRRGKSKIEDQRLINALKKSKKDISENVMITDLVRNDLSIFAKKASVRVEELCKVYSFRKVHQMITTISCRIDSNICFTDILKATFPMGSMTGAPKIRAMELIESFEEFKRGVFSGAIGYVTPQADFDFNVVIRTILYNLENNYLSIGVGGAITINSNPDEEYEECLTKVEPLFNVLNCKFND